MSPVICRLVEMVPPDMPLNRVLEAHREQCLRCQATDARSTGMSRELSTMGGETMRAPDGLATVVMSRLPAQDGSDPRRPLVVRLAIRYSVAAVIGVATIAALLARALSRRSPLR
jgi:hypothetical protein